MSGLFGGGGGGESSVAKRLTSIDLQSSAYGEVVPLVYGRTRVAPNLFWYGDFTAIKHEQDVGGKGGGGGSITTYTYEAAVVLGLCEGPITSIDRVWLNKETTTLADAGFTLFTGTGGQATWSHLTSDHPTEAIPYDHTAYVAHPNISLGSNAAAPSLNFLVHTPSAFSGSIFDALPSVILTDYLTDAEHGAQFPYLAPLTDFATYCQAMGLFLSPAETSQRQAADFLRELLQITNSECRWSAGELQVLPYGDKAVTGNSATFTPNLTPEYSFGDDDFLHDDGADPVRLVRKAQSERYNRVRIEYLDMYHDYNTAVAEAVDDADIALNGERPMETVQYHSITTVQTARLVAQLILQRQLYVVNTYQFKVRADYSLLDPLDLVDITDASLGLASQLVRITSITDEDDDSLTIEAEEVPIGAHNAPRYEYEAAQGYAANYGVSPGSVNAPRIFVAPPYLVGTAGGAETWVAVSGSDANWGGCTVWMSFDNTDYRQVGMITRPARYGVTQDGMLGVTDPDSTSTVTVQLNDTALTLVSGTQDDVDNLRTLAMIGSEVVAYRDAALVGAGQYDLHYFRRGLYRTANEAHASGEPFVRLDNAIFKLPFDPGMAGQTAYFKFTSFNIYGGAEESLASVVDYSFAIPSGFTNYVGDAVALQVNGTCTAAGYSAFKATGSDTADSAAWSTEKYLNGCALSFRVARTDCDLAGGLESSASAPTVHSAPKFCFYFSSAGQAYVQEAGTNLKSLGSYTTSQVYTVSYDGKAIRYLKDGAQVWATPAAGQSLFAYFRMITVGSHVESIRFVPASGVQTIAGNLINTSQWLVGGFGTQGNFTNYYNGTNQDSSIVLGGGSYPLGPYGQSEPLWRCQGTGTGANGGWSNDVDLFGVDPTKPHRYVVWVRWNGTGTPTIAFGCDGLNTKNLDGTTNADPYFMSGAAAALGIAANKWYLAVGMIHGAGYGTVDLGLAGLYDPTTGQKIYDGTEFKFASASVPDQMHRALQSNANNASCVTYFAKPRFEEVTGNEPTIEMLLSPRGALAYLDDVDTAQIVEGAATDIYDGGVTGPVTVDGYSHASPLTITTLSVPSATYDALHIVSFSGTAEAVWDPAESSSLQVAISSAPSMPYAGSTIMWPLSKIVGPGDGTTGFMLEVKYSVSAGNAVTYSFNCSMPGSLSGTAGDLRNVTAKAIVVKR